MERTWPPETVSSSLSASLSLSSLTLQTLSCCFHLWRHAQRQNFSLFCTVDGRTPSIYTEIPLIWSLAVDIISTSSGNPNQWNISRESTHFAFVIILSIIAYCLIVFFLMILWLFVYFCQWSKHLLVFFSKTSTVLQWKPLCLVGIFFLYDVIFTPP